MAISTLPLTREVFETGFLWESYLSQMKHYRETSGSLYEEAKISEETVERFAALVERHGGELSISALTEAWCGDSAVTLPLVARLAESVRGIRLRVLVGKEHPRLKEAYAAEGFESIPLLSFFNAEWRETGRWMERPKSADERVMAWIDARPRIAELRGSEEPAAKQELRGIFSGLVTEMAGWYRAGMWNDMLDEIETLLTGSADA